ncbi:MAG: DUF4434 domain-containing protein [Nitrospiraceae bacterium]|nr:DUF4434 domain-containing protein [Nitrospiraceae bacterium]
MRLLLTIALTAFMPTLAAGAQTEQAASSPSRPLPLMRGTLWWLVAPHTDGTRQQLEQAIQAQRDVGFDVLWIFNTPALLEQAIKAAPDAADADVLESVYTIADKYGMRVIADLPPGGWYGKAPAKEILDTNTRHIAAYHARYGRHASFWGWYLNYEINPIAPDDVEESAYWRKLWREVVDECHSVAPGSVVTISPFFLLDNERKRGFIYLSPEQYAAWWGKTLEETGIDILMLQDSGEHLSFFTLEQRAPFFAAVRDACHKAGAEFWVNVETGEAHVADWDEYLRLSKGKKAPWRFTPIDWLEQKLALAARYGDSIINWGYFPFMDPLMTSQAKGEFAPTPAEARKAYEQYKRYYERVRANGARRPTFKRGKSGVPR